MHDAWTNAEEKAALIQDSAFTAGIHIEEVIAVSLALGAEITVNNRRYIVSQDGDLFSVGQKFNIQKQNTRLERLHRFMKNHITAHWSKD